MKIIFYGGVNEVGGNKILIEDNGTKILLDFGRSMGYASRYYEEFIKVRSKCAILDLLKLGVLPRINGLYPKHLLDITMMNKDEAIDVTSILPWKQAKDYWVNDTVIPYNDKDKIDGVFISHAHFDHIQDVSFIHKDINIYTTETTKTIAKAICDISQSSVEHQFFEVNNSMKISFKGENYKTAFPDELDIKEDVAKKDITCQKTGYEFTQELKTTPRNFATSSEGKIGSLSYKLIPVGHSIPGACSVLITTSDDKKLLYTGDIRFHGKNEPDMHEYVKSIGNKKIDVMICEGTRIDSDKELTEENVYEDILEEIKEIKGLLLIDFGWKDVTRFETIAKIAEKTERTFVITPKLAYLLYELHIMDSERYVDPTTFTHVKVYLKRQENLLYSKNYYDRYKVGYLNHWGRNKAKSDKNIVRICEKLGIGGDRGAEKQDLSDEEKKSDRYSNSSL